MVKDKFTHEDPEVNRIWQEMLNDIAKLRTESEKVEDQQIIENVFKKVWRKLRHGSQK